MASQNSAGPHVSLPFSKKESPRQPQSFLPFLHFCAMKNSWASEPLSGLFIKILPGQASARGVFTREEKNERPKSPPQVEVVVADKVFEQAQEREVNAMRGRASWRRRKKLVTACDVSGLSSARHQLCPRSVMSHSNDPADQSPEHWRQLARQAASQANMSSDPEVRDALNAIAEEYIVLADKAEAKAKASDGPSEVMVPRGPF